MSLATARRDIEKRLADNWGTTPIAYDNVQFSPPATSWIRLSILDGDAIRKNVGNPGCHRQTGVIMIQIFVTENEGTNVARQYADTLSALYRDVTFNGITCREASPMNIGLVQGWYQFNVSIPYYYDAYYST
jgi:hypothetical protein